MIKFYRQYGLMGIALLCTLIFPPVLGGCGSGSENAAESIIKDQADVTETYVNSLTRAETAEEIVAAVEAYTGSMKELIPRLKAFREKYPEFQHGQVPESVASDLERLKTASAGIPNAMMKMGTYMANPKVQAAMEKMGETLTGIN